jgi:hypothetical protein
LPGDTLFAAERWPIQYRRAIPGNLPASASPGANEIALTAQRRGRNSIYDIRFLTLFPQENKMVSHKRRGANVESFWRLNAVNRYAAGTASAI